MADAQRAQDPHHARGNRAQVRDSRGEHPHRRAVRPGVSENQPEQQDPGDRGRYVALQWLMFQMGSIGPMMGQAGHFRSNAVPERIDYAINRYTNEVRRLHGVMEKRLAEVPYFAGAEYSIADIAIFPWLRASERNGI